MLNRNVKYTHRDYMCLPESEEKRYELIDGELYMVPSPTPTHQDIVRNLMKVLDDFVQGHGLGKVYFAPLDVVLSEHDVLQPDILYVARNREGIIGERNIQGAPDLVAEVLSPGTANRDRMLKRVRYGKFGVKEYWIADPQAKSIEVLRAGESGLEAVQVFPEGTTVTSPLLEGLRVDVGRVFSSSTPQ